MLHCFGREITHVIWDFNGTVLNDLRANIDSINEMLAPRGLPILPCVEAFRRVFDFPVREYYLRLGFDFEKEDYDTVLAPLWVSLYNEKSKSAPFYEGVLPLAQALRARGVSQSLLSVTEKRMLQEQLAARNAAHLFDEIWGTDTIHAHGKLDLARAWRQAHPDAVALLIGDTSHDAETAVALDALCVLVASGYHDRERLQRCGVPVVADLAECRELLFKTDSQL